MNNEKEKNKCDSKKVSKEMDEFKEGELHIGKSVTIVSKPKTTCCHFIELA